MNQKMIQEALSVLINIRLELRGNADMRDVRHQLKKVIRELETALDSGTTNDLSSLKVLTLIAAIVGKVPVIVKAIEHLTNIAHK